VSGTRAVLLTSAGGGVGVAVQQAAVASKSDYRIVGTSSIPAVMQTGEMALSCPATAQRAAFQGRILQLVVRVGQCLIVPGRDEDADALTEIAARFSAMGGAMLASGPAWAVSAAYDKAATARMLGTFGLPIAVTAENLTEAVELARAFGWPLVVKPRHGNASRGVRVVSDEAALRACFRSGRDIAQEFLAVCPDDRRSWDGRFRGGQDGEYSLQMILDRRGAEIGHFCSRNTLADGVPRLVETVADVQISGLLQQAREALGSLSAWGAWNLQGRRCLDGRIRVFEVNARFTGLSGVRARLGFNELDLLYESLVLGRAPARPGSPVAGLLIDTRSCGESDAKPDRKVLSE
jgi:carbamoylphosphate synthase large subunit